MVWGLLVFVFYYLYVRIVFVICLDVGSLDVLQNEIKHYHPTQKCKLFSSVSVTYLTWLNGFIYANKSNALLSLCIHI